MITFSLDEIVLQSSLILYILATSSYWKSSVKHTLRFETDFSVIILLNPINICTHYSLYKYNLWFVDILPAYLVKLDCLNYVIYFQAYLSLPEGLSSVAGLIAMMTDHYNMLVRFEFLFLHCLNIGFCFCNIGFCFWW